MTLSERQVKLQALRNALKARFPHCETQSTSRTDERDATEARCLNGRITKTEN